MSNRIPTVVLALSISAGPLSAQTALDSVRRLDSLWTRAYATADTVAIDRIFASNIAVTASNGRSRTRAEEIAEARPTPAVTIHSLRTRNVEIHLTGPNAVLMGDVSSDLTANGQRQAMQRRYTATYARGGPLGWQMTALHFFPPAAAAPVATPAGAGFEGKWEGALVAGGGRLRIALEIARSADGLLSGVLRSLDQGGGPIPIERITQTGDSVRVDIPVIGGRYDAVLTADRSQMNGVFTQGGPVPLVMMRTAAASSAPATPTPAPVSPFGLMVEVQIPAPPTPVMGGGKRHLIYELHLTNFAGGELLLTKLEALGPNGVLASYEGAALNAILMQPRLGTPDNRSLTAAGRAIAFIQITLDSGVAMPTSVRHRVTAGTQSLETAEMPIGAAKAIVVGAPFRGSDWRAANGPSNTTGHRRALIPIGGKPAIAQRFAIDWVQVNPGGATFAGNQLDNKSYRAYGVEILAVADGMVSAVKDGIPDNIPGVNSRAVPITLETIGGNYIVQDIGGGRYAFYAHLQPGSLRVKAGQRVKKGDVIGLLGNSGNSTEPHLHFHIMDGTSPLGSEGLPYVIDSWELQTSPGTWERRVNQLPMMNMMVRFPVPPRAR